MQSTLIHCFCQALANSVQQKVSAVRWFHLPLPVSKLMSIEKTVKNCSKMFSFFLSTQQAHRFSLEGRATNSLDCGAMPLKQCQGTFATVFERRVGQAQNSSALTLEPWLLSCIVHHTVIGETCILEANNVHIFKAEHANGVSQTNLLGSLGNVDEGVGKLDVVIACTLEQLAHRIWQIQPITLRNWERNPSFLGWKSGGGGPVWLPSTSPLAVQLVKLDQLDCKRRRTG